MIDCMNRRSLLKLGAGLTGLAMVPGCAHTNRVDLSSLPQPALPVLPSYQPHVASYWVPRGQHHDSYPQFKRMVEAITDFSWLSRGDRVFLKLTLNSPRPYPATTDPWLVWAMVNLLREKGAGVIEVGDQSGMEHVYQSPDKTRGSSRECCSRAGILAAIESVGATPVFFEEQGYDAFRPTNPPGDHHWPEPPWIPSHLDQVDHIVYLPRVASHALADSTLGFKISVGWLRCDSRFVFHKGGESFSAMYQEVNDVPEIASRLRLVVSSGAEVLTTIGPDMGYVARPDHGLMMASTDLLAHELLAYAWLTYNRFFNTFPTARSFDHTVADMRSGLHKLFMSFVGTREQHAGVTPIPGFRPGRVRSHPAVVNTMQRMGGSPASIQWEQLDAAPDAKVAAFLADQLTG